MIDTLNIGSSYCIMVSEDTHRFMYYFLALGACIREFSHLRKVIVVDDIHLHGKYEGVLLSPVTQDTKNNVYPIAFCVVDKENDASWTFFFEKLKDIVVDESYLCFISDRHKSITNGIAKFYNHAHHRYCMRNLGKNLWVNHHRGDSLYLYYNVAKAYSLEKLNDHFAEFKDKSLEAAVILEHEVGFKKWSRAHFPSNRYDVMTTNITDSLNVMLIDEREYLVACIFNSIAKTFGELFRERHAHILKSKGNKWCQLPKGSQEKNDRRRLFVCGEHIGDDNQFTVFDAGSTSIMNLL
ncbi:hypothetical protein KY285_007657 [Solanum tuberosum]|nr:hypothetical protein KY285_007657 [Solanum tuberosum]